jgi:transcriptional regulator with XRE-family HTH domain
MELEREFSEVARALGMRIKELRQERNLYQTHLSQKTILSVTSISDLENSKLNALFDSLISIASAFQVETASLFDQTKTRSFQLNLKELSFEDRCQIEKVMLGTRIKDIIEHRGIDIIDASILARIDDKNLRNYIQGKENISLFIIFKIAKGLQVETIDLFDYTGPLPDNFSFRAFID